MSKSYPTIGSIDFLLCEDVRLEIGGKATVVGLFPTRVINILAKALPTKIRIAFFLLFHDGKGEFEARFQVLGPDNDVGREDKLPVISLGDEGGGMIIGVGTLEFLKTGDHHLILILDEDRRYDWAFKVTHNPDAALS